MNPSIAFLYNLQQIGIKFGLRNIKELLKAFGNPHKSIPSVHIAGTNGKGSTSAMVAAVLTAEGYSVGLYTSPHLVRFHERIRINGVMISDADVIRLVKMLTPAIKKTNATFFESTTAIAFKYFAEKKVDIAVIETGLGGRLDATNVLRPLAAAITTIGLEHTEYLGSTLELIAAEKAGIIKKNIPVILGSIKKEAVNVIESIAGSRSSRVIHSSTISLPKGIQLQLRGSHQRNNAKTALGILKAIEKSYPVSHDAVYQGLQRTREYSGLRGRFEVHAGHPAVIVDVAHNPDGVRTLVRALQRMPLKKFVIVFAVMKDKDVTLMLRLFRSVNPVIVVTQVKGSRSLEVEKLAEISVKAGLRTFVHSDPGSAFKLGKKLAGKNGAVVVTGSHYLAGEIIPMIEKKS